MHHFIYGFLKQTHFLSQLYNILNTIMLFLFLSKPLLSEGFLAGTQVKTPAGYIAIENLRLDDQVICHNFEGKCIPGKITNIVTKTTRKYLNIHIKNEVISVAHEHKFYLPIENRWIEVQNITPQHILLSHGTYFISIDSIQTIDSDTDIETYDITVFNYHNFCVSPLAIHVHNVLPAAALAAIGAGAAGAGGTAAGASIGVGIGAMSAEAVAINTAGTALFGPVFGIVALGLGGAFLLKAIHSSANHSRSNPNNNPKARQQEEELRLAWYMYVDQIEKEKSARAAEEAKRAAEQEPAKPITTNNGDIDNDIEKKVDDILEDAAPGRKTKGKTQQFDKPGSYDDAEKDFKSLNPDNIQTIPIGQIGTLSDGRNIIVRKISDEGRPTLEIQNTDRHKIKIRYGDKV